MKPAVSIIIPTYNRGNLISDTIESATNQTHANLEILIIDDGSTDETEEIVREFCNNDARIQYLKRPQNLIKGANACRNYGLSIAKGKYIKWLDSDDLLIANCIEKQVEKAEAEQADLCICNTKVFHTSSPPTNFANLPNWGMISGQVNLESFLLNGTKWHTISGLWRKDWFINLKPFDETQQNAQEWLMHIQALCRKPKISIILETLCLGRTHVDNMSNRRNKKGRYYYYDCTARLKALKALKDFNYKIPQAQKKLKKQFLWYHLFVLYKGNPWLWMKLFFKYPLLLVY
jgi:glycosyltransferase involved in cell wall biosynthesis